MVALCFETADQSPSMEVYLDSVNYFFVSIFTLECLMKLMAFNWRYFTGPWNIFDLAIVILSLTGC